MDKEDKKNPVPIEEKDEVLSDNEITIYFFQKYFNKYPETDEERAQPPGRILKITKAHYDACHRLEKVILDGSKRVQLARKMMQWYRTLKTHLFTLQEITFIAETYIIEYEMSEEDETIGIVDLVGPKGFDGLTIDEKKNLDGEKNKGSSGGDENPASASATNSEPKAYYSERKLVECVELMISVYCHAERIKSDIYKNWKIFEARDKEKSKDMGSKGNVGKSEGKKLDAAAPPQAAAAAPPQAAAAAPPQAAAAAAPPKAAAAAAAPPKAAAAAASSPKAAVDALLKAAAAAAAAAAPLPIEKVYADLLRKAFCKKPPLVKISRDRLLFIEHLMYMIRGALLIFKRVNTEWLKDAEKVMEKEKRLSLIDMEIGKQQRRESIKKSKASIRNQPSASAITPSVNTSEVPNRTEMREPSPTASMEVDAKI